MSRFTAPALAVAIAAWVAVLASGQQNPPKEVAAQSADQQAVGQVSQEFVKAFNAGKAEEIAGLFHDGAELIDDAGVVHKGSAAIRDAFGRFFEKFPGATSTMTADSIWMVGPSLAIEEGQRVVSAKDSRAAASRYTLVLMKHEGKWRIVSARELEDDYSLSPHERLQPLGWLVGDWVDERSDAVVRISCRWSEDENYLLMDFQAQVQGKPALKSAQRIGWDPLTQKVKSWVFDSDGGHGEAIWSQVEGRWVIKSTAVMPDGTTGSATIVIERAGDDRYTMKGFDRIRGDAAEGDFEIAIVRTPPAPAK